MLDLRCRLYLAIAVELAGLLRQLASDGSLGAVYVRVVVEAQDAAVRRRTVSNRGVNGSVVHPAASASLMGEDIGLSMGDDQKTKGSIGISELPVDELIHYGCELGLKLSQKMGHGELLRKVRDRQELLLDMDREAILDIAVWARYPVRASASKEELAKLIASITKMDFEGLSDPGLKALAQLREVTVREDESRPLIEAKLKDAEPFMERMRRRRRELMGNMVSKIIIGSGQDDEKTYRFLPEEGANAPLKQHIAQGGVVGGIARTLRSVADDYVYEKLDEIEARIDKKLDEIDRRLEEWRDREIANRLKIIKITLVASVLVALLSLGYNALKHKPTPDNDVKAPTETAPEVRWIDPCSERELWV